MTPAFVILIHIICTGVCSGAGIASGEGDSRQRVSGTSQPKFLNRKAQEALIRKNTVEENSDELENPLITAIEDAYGSLNRLFDIVPPNELRKVLPRNIVLISGSTEVVNNSYPDILKNCFLLVRENMKQIFEDSKFPLGYNRSPGWHDDIMMESLYENDVYHVILREEAVHSKERSLQNRTVAPIGKDVVGLLDIKLFPIPFGATQGLNILYLYELQLDKSIQGRGIGFALVEYVKMLLAAFKFDAIELTVQTTNVRAFKFYKERCGFEVIETFPESTTLQWIPPGMSQNSSQAPSYGTFNVNCTTSDCLLL